MENIYFHPEIRGQPVLLMQQGRLRTRRGLMAAGAARSPQDAAMH